ncbi:hypothetical protein QNH14_07905 [Apirhabdus apintestini]|nr:hypothetical protein QNH14_07905 [Enterobacteriaceae bacterium CA-0114]
MDFVMVLLSAVAGLAIAEYSAPVLGLVDKPDARKVHEGHIPWSGDLYLGCHERATVPQA